MYLITVLKYFWSVFKYFSKYSPSYSNKYKQQKVCCLNDKINYMCISFMPV